MTGRLFLSTIIGSALFVICGSTSAQDSVAAANLAAAKELSAASGRPIFAIAGQST